jgi:hypothetical protein
MFRRLLILPAVLLLALPANASASASRQVDIVSFDGSFPTDTFCPFTLTEHQSGTFQIATFFNTAGNPTKSIITVRSHYAVSLSGNGRTLVGVSPFMQKDILYPNGDVASRTLTGVVWQFRVPGGGLVLVDTGRVVRFHADGPVVFEAGQHPVLDGNTQALCDYFAS